MKVTMVMMPFIANIIIIVAMKKNLRVFMSNINMDGTLEIKKFSFAALNPNKLDAK